MRNHHSLTLSLFIGRALLAAPMLAQAGGTIKGKVTFSGKVLPPKEFLFPSSRIQNFAFKIQAKALITKLVC